MGAKGKYNQNIVKQICDSITTGNTIKSICTDVGIAESTYYQWLQDKSEFSECIKKAEELRKDYGKALAVSSIFKAMQNGQWQAGAWWLERVYSKEFKNVQEVRQTPDLKEAREKLGKIIDAKFKKAS